MFDWTTKNDRTVSDCDDKEKIEPPILNIMRYNMQVFTVVNRHRELFTGDACVDLKHHSYLGTATDNSADIVVIVIQILVPWCTF